MRGQRGRVDKRSAFTGRRDGGCAALIRPTAVYIISERLHQPLPETDENPKRDIKMTILTAYFDGGCPMCSKEIAHYRRIDRRSAIDWVDITNDGGALAAVGIDYPTAMRRIHARDADGNLLTGVPAFVAIWQRLPGYRHLATLVQGLRLVPLLDWAYGRFADWRLRRRCRDGACTID
jgi:predicted DCC family thiol-disulfide oxidoreductase YuxK